MAIYDIYDINKKTPQINGVSFLYRIGRTSNDSYGNQTAEHYIRILHSDFYYNIIWKE